MLFHILLKPRKKQKYRITIFDIAKSKSGIIYNIDIKKGDILYIKNKNTAKIHFL